MCLGLEKFYDTILTHTYIYAYKYIYIYIYVHTTVDVTNTPKIYMGFIIFSPGGRLFTARVVHSIY